MPDSPCGSAVAAVAPGVAPDAIEALRADLLLVYRAVVALEKRVNESTVNMIEIKPQLIALKVHTESFPNALREMRRHQTATQKAISEFDARLRSLESRIKGAAAPSET
jgi:hypothetical protein